MDIPEHTRHSLMLYIVHGYKPGRGLRSILENDLFSTVRCCDDATLAVMRPLVTWVHSFAHGDSHGTRDKVAAWLGSPKKCYDTQEGLIKLGYPKEAATYNG
jgi:hypothetical protein